MAKKISDKHRAFCHELMKNGFNQPAAYMAIYPNIKKEVTASAAATRLLKDVNVIEYLDELKEAQKEKALVDSEDVIHKLELVLDHCMELDRKGGMKEMGAIRAIELLGKYNAMWTDKLKKEVEQKVIIVDKELKEMMEDAE